MNKHPKQLEALLDALALGQSLPEALNLPVNTLNQVSHEQLLANPEDVADGVVKVETKFSTLFFQVFDSLLVKTFDNDKVSCIFFAEVKDGDQVIRLANLLYSKLGSPLNTTDDFIPFTNTDKIRSLSKGKYVTVRFPVRQASE